MTKVTVVKAGLTILLGALLAIGLLWGPAVSAADCLYLLNTPCQFLGVNLWQLPPDWALAVVRFPWLLPVVVVAPASLVLVTVLLLVRRGRSLGTRWR